MRIAAEAGVPLVPVILWGTQRMMTKDHPRDFSRGKTIAVRVAPPMYPTGEDPAAETADLHRVMSSLLDETIRTYPAEEQPPGSWWLPASYGGSAPTPEEAERLDAEEKRERRPGASGRSASDSEPSGQVDLSLCRHVDYLSTMTLDRRGPRGCGGPSRRRCVAGRPARRTRR